VETTPQVKQVAAHEITVDIQSPASGRVIGHHGRRINAMEQLAAAFMDYHGAPKTAVVLDTSDYRQRRREALHELAERSVTEVVASGQAVFLDPMPARERKQLHRELEDNAHVRTYSHGREPYRSVVIAPRN
jgi:spoIIIJ-associated protein